MSFTKMVDQYIDSELGKIKQERDTLQERQDREVAIVDRRQLEIDRLTALLVEGSTIKRDRSGNPIPR